MCSLDEKVRSLLEQPGAALDDIHPSKSAQEIIKRVEQAIASEYGKDAFDIAFHLSDWSGDAAFLVALHLFPDQFSNEEIMEGILAVIVHAPNHMAAAGKLAGCPVEDVFDYE
jgi:hypothetical protein